MEHYQNSHTIFHSLCQFLQAGKQTGEGDTINIALHCFILCVNFYRQANRRQASTKLYSIWFFLSTYTVLQKFPFGARHKHSADYCRDFLHLRPKTDSFASMLRLRSAATAAFHSYFQVNQESILTHAAGSVVNSLCWYTCSFMLLSSSLTLSPFCLSTWRASCSKAMDRLSVEKQNRPDPAISQKAGRNTLYCEFIVAVEHSC